MNFLSYLKNQQILKLQANLPSRVFYDELCSEMGKIGVPNPALA
jgi:hypothetical protein